MTGHDDHTDINVRGALMGIARGRRVAKPGSVRDRLVNGEPLVVRCDRLAVALRGQDPGVRLSDSAWWRLEGHATLTPATVPS